MRREGFVVKKEEASNFFDETLPKLGLNSKEAGDFKKAWLKYFSGAPYYFLTFYWGDFLEKLAPLKVTQVRIRSSGF